MSHIDNAGRNRQVVLNIIREQGPLSRREIADACRLSIATTKRLSEDLLSGRLIEETSAGVRPRGRGHGRGRKASALRLNERYGRVLGLNIEPAAIELCILSFSGEVLYEREVRQLGLDRAEILDRAAGLVRAALRETDPGQAGPLGLGAGITGLVDARAGTVLYCPRLPGWEEVPLSAMLEQRFGLPVTVEDSARCLTLAEKRYGLGRGLSSFLYLYIGHNVGGGIILGNRFYRGHSGLAGELGHISVREGGPLCNCGNHGCLEALVSTSAVLSFVRSSVAGNVPTTLREAALAGRLAPEDILPAAGAGDRLAGVVLESISRDIGTALAGLINVFDPGVVILAGEIIESLGDGIFPAIETAARARALPAIARRTRIVRGAFTRYTAARGAATLVIERLLGSEVLNP